MTVMASGAAERASADLFECFAEQARATPAARAVVTADETVDYGTLLARAQAYARALRDLGVVAEQPVGVLMRRTPDLIACLLGCLGAGAAYVPLDLENPAERSRRIVEGAGCRLIIGDAGLHRELTASLGQPMGVETRFIDVRELLAAANAPVAIAPSADAAFAADASMRMPVSAASGGSSRLAYILHTSGSTGAPKGVETEQENVVSLVRAAARLLAFGPDDCFLATSPIGFDSAVAEVFLPLLTGGSLLLLDRNAWLQPAMLARQVVAYGVTVAATGPSTWAVVLSECPAFPRLRVLISHAEALPVELGRRLVGRADQVWNLYGPTETTVWATGHRLQRGEFDALSSGGTVPIGLPLDNAKVVVLDESGQIAQDGQPGELCIGGGGVARGYRNDPAQTREKFIERGPDRLRLYRTGDVTARRPDGTLEYLGRVDDQLKIRGIRIEPGEVESALLAHPAVRQAAVTWFVNAEGSRSMVAGIATHVRGETLEPQMLVRWLEQRLPPQMIPSRFVTYDALPLLSTGKVDRQAIRQRAGPGAPEDAPPVAQTATELALAALWQRVLRVPPVRGEDHFFAVGGDSLAAVRLVSAIESTFKVKLPIEAVFESPVLNRLAARIDLAKARSNGEHGTGFVFPIVESQSGFPLFFCSVDLRLAAAGAWRVPCPLYAVAYWAQGKGFIEARSLVELAATHVVEIRSRQPVGPYRLAGAGFGGLVALEAAQQLRREGQEVELLFLLDPLIPPGLATGGARLQGATRGAATTAGGEGGSVGVRGGTAPARRGLGQRWWSQLMYWAAHRHGQRPGLVSSMLLPADRQPEYWFKREQLAAAYRVETYRGRVLASFASAQDRELWRSRFAGPSELLVLESLAQGKFSEASVAQWQPALARCVEALDWGEGDSLAIAAS